MEHEGAEEDQSLCSDRPVTDGFAQVCNLLLLGHAKGSENQEQTLNRVFQKCLRIFLGESIILPTLSRSNVTVTLETRRVRKLRKLINRELRDLSTSPYPKGSIKRFKRRVRVTKDIPLIIATFAGKDYLLDGNRRIQYLSALGQEMAQTYVCRIL